MPATEKYVRPYVSYRVYGTPRTHIEMAVLLRDLRENPGQWHMYTKCKTYKAALDRISAATHGEKTKINILRRYPNNIQMRACVDPDDGPLVVIRWVP